MSSHIRRSVHSPRLRAEGQLDRRVRGASARGSRFRDTGDAHGAARSRTGQSDACVHVLMMISIPPEYAVSQMIGDQAQDCEPSCSRRWREETHFCGHLFWSRAYFVWTIGRDEVVISESIRKREREKLRPRSMSLLALTSHRQVDPTLRGRVSSATAASSGHITKAPGSAGI